MWRWGIGFGDLLNDYLGDNTKSIKQNLFSCKKINIATCQKQERLHDYGLISITNAAAIVTEIEPTSLTGNVIAP